MQHMKPSIYAFYHYFPPDDVVSSVHYGELCAGLVQKGWEVTAFPCRWGCRDDSISFPPVEQWRGVSVRRLWRPRFRQSSGIGRLLNSFGMIVNWSLLALKHDSRPQVVLIGTDPILSVLVAIVWKILRPKTKIAHWCFDLYPEAAIADGLMRPDGLLARILRRILQPAYRACSLIVDIGPCMRQLLLRYPSDAIRATVVPWALEQPVGPPPVNIDERTRLFGNTRLALLYSGNFGRAHSYREVLALASQLASEDVSFAFSTRGNREAELRSAIRDQGIPISIVPFASAENLSARLACADVHIVSLRPAWTGTVVPSKFFGALSVGRPVLFSGSDDSSLAEWIKTYEVGWILQPDRIMEVAAQLIKYSQDPALQNRMQTRCFEAYREHFSREVQIEHWDCLLRSLLS
jgi:colanic acid biosynthesis glycosyl transferase WcaI